MSREAPWNRMRAGLVAALEGLGRRARGIRFDRAALVDCVQALKARIDGAQWTTKLVASVAVFAAILVLAGPVHYLFRDLIQLQAESLDRARSLVRVLALANQEGFARNQEVLFSVDSVRGEPGVEAALVADAAGIVMAPADYFGKRLDEVAAGLSADMRMTGGVHLHKLGGGRYYLSYPVSVAAETYRGITHVAKGVAVIRFDATSTLGRMGNQIAEALKYAVFLGLAAWAFVVLMKRWTLRPIADALERVEYPDGAANAGGSNIRFSELERLTAACERANRPFRETAAVKPTAAPFETTSPEGARAVARADDMDAVVLDGHNVVVAVSGEPGRCLGCEPKAKQHMLEAFAGSAYFSELMDLVQGARPPDGSCVSTSADNKLSFAAQWSIADHGTPLLAIRVERRRQRRRKGGDA